MNDEIKVPSAVSFEALRLYPGAALQIQSLAGEANHGVKFVGAMKDRSVLVTLPIVNGKGIWVQAGQVYVVRGFTGKYAFAFEAPALVALAQPFPYIHFAYPQSVNSRAVRKSLRVRAHLPATVTPRTGGNPVPVAIVDLSTTGAMLDSHDSIGQVGDVTRLEFSVTFESISAHLDISAIIRSIQKTGDGNGFRSGIEFEKVAHNDSLILRCFVHTIETGAEKMGNKAPAK